MFEDFDFDFDFDAIPKPLIKEAVKEAKVLVDIYASEANHNKLRNALEKKCRNASSDAERRVYQKMLDKL